jgi:hypothetical protein
MNRYKFWMINYLIMTHMAEKKSGFCIFSYTSSCVDHLEQN